MLGLFLSKMCQVAVQDSPAKQEAKPEALLLNRSTEKGIQQAGSGRLAVKWWENGNCHVTGQTVVVKCQKFDKRWRRRLAITWIVAAVIVSVYVFDFLNTGIVHRRKEMLINMCEERAWMLQDQFMSSMNHVRSLTALVTTFHLGKQPSALDQGTFAAYTARTSFERPLMTGVAYAKRVLHSEREAFEREHGWSIKGMYTKELQPVQDEYAPTVLTQETLSHLASLDMMSGEEDRENILRSRASGKGALTSPFRLLESNHLGVVLTFTVYDSDLRLDAMPEDRVQATAGYVGGAFDFESLVENLLRQLAESQAIIVNVFDVTNQSMPLVMYGPNVSDDLHTHVSHLDFGDPLRKHEMRCRSCRKPPIPWLAITTAGGIFVIALLAAHILYAAGNRIEKVEEDCRKMEALKVKAESADVAKSQFLATVSHEIRTPMNGVLGMLQMLMDTELEATQCDYARTAHESGKQLIKLINEVLDQAKIESGRIELESVPFNLRAILDDILSLFSAEIKDRKIELAVYVSESVPEVMVGDPVRLHQIITNLVGNSVKFTERGHIFVCVCMADNAIIEMDLKTDYLAKQGEPTDSQATYTTLSALEVANGGNSWETFKLVLENEVLQKTSTKEGSVEATDMVRLVFSVEDTGVGIPLPAQERVFTPFMQADSSTSRNYGGTGIGLSISRRLVELMKGQIGFVSMSGVGTTFKFIVPFHKQDESVLDSGKHAPTNLKYPEIVPLPTKFKGMKALVVDPNLVRSQVSRYHLQRLGVQVEIANDCNAAISKLKSTPDPASNKSSSTHIDVVLVEKDAWGPNTGLCFPQQISDAGIRFDMLLGPRLVLLALSIKEEEAQKAKATGFVDTIIKPLRASNVALCLQTALGISSKKRNHGKHLKETHDPLRNLLSGKCILVVDDNRVNRRVAAGALTKYGAQVECVDSGKVAIQMLQPPHNFDACFMDIQMPEMDGFEATRQIRNAESLFCEKRNGETDKGDRQWHVPILAMTADVIQATDEQCVRSGMDGYVSKPFEEEQLYKVVVQFFYK